MAVLGAVVAVPEAILIPFWTCTTKSCWANGLDVLTSNLSLKSSPLTTEEISDTGPELVAERAGLDIIHASSWEKADVQCCLPLWLALAQASTKDLLSLLHCLDVHPPGPQMEQGLWTSRLHSPAAIRHWGQEAWSSWDDIGRLHRSTLFLQIKNK